MDILELLASSQDVGEIKKAFTDNKPERKVPLEDCNNQYDPLKHKTLDLKERPNKMIKKPDGKDDQGNAKFIDAVEPVTRIALALQKLIVKRSTGFMLGNPVKMNVEYESDSETAEILQKMIDRTWRDNKLDFKNKEIARTLFKECEVAELWHLVEDENYWGELAKGSKYRLKLKILKPGTDDMYPYFDSTGDMVAFARGYKTGKGESEVEHFDIYTAEKIMKYEKAKSGDWALAERQMDALGKIGIIYYKTDYPDWHDVQNMIERLEEGMSNHADTNDYNGSPILFLKGNITGMPAKGGKGKTLKSSDEKGDGKYLNWDSMPESIKLEFSGLKDAIYEITQTPDISFSNLKDIGSAVSGVALKLMFADAHMKAMENWEVFGVGVQRRLNLVKHILGTIVNVKLNKEVYNLHIEPECIPFLPRNEKELAEMANNAIEKGSMSKETWAENHPMIIDAAEELERVKLEGEREDANTLED